MKIPRRRNSVSASLRYNESAKVATTNKKMSCGRFKEMVQAL